ncbi:MAG: hypothetical protein KIC80_00520 [Brachyspira sp.]|jgi:hypothetical protein|nr:hypothetical protein [Brachyspira sp.]
MLTTPEEIKNTDNVSREEIPSIVFEFMDTLLKIKHIENVVKICFLPGISDIFVVTTSDDIDLNEKIMETFSQWEACYKIFPELHIINEEEEFYIPDGAHCI